MAGPTLTSYVVNLASEASDGQEGPAYKLYAEPGNPAVNIGYTLIALAPFEVTLAAPYGDLKAKQTAGAETFTEIVHLGGQVPASTENPVAEILSALPVTPLVDETETIVLPRQGGTALPLLLAQAGRLVPRQALWGTLKLKYRSFPAQRWPSTGQPAAGEYVYLATAAEFSEPQHLTVPVGDAVRDELTDEEKAAAEIAIPPYAVSVIPSSPRVKQRFKIRIASRLAFTLRNPYGSAAPASGAASELSEALNLSGGTSIAASEPIAVLRSVQAVTPLVNKNGLVRAASSCRLVNGQLATPEPLWGTVQITATGFQPQVWQINGLPAPGQYLFVATSSGLKEPVPIEVTIPAGREYGWEHEDMEDTPDRKTLWLYVNPWLEPVTLEHSAQGMAGATYQGVNVFNVTEVVAVVNGQGALSYPYHGTLSYSWQFEDLGTWDADESGAITTAVMGTSLLKITYRTYRHQWEVWSSTPQVLVWVEEQGRVASSYRLDFRAKDEAGDPIDDRPAAPPAPYYLIQTCPPTVVGGEPFRIAAYADFDLQIIWPYGGITKLGSFTEGFTFVSPRDLTGAESIELDYPVRSAKVMAWTPIVDASGRIVVEHGDLVKIKIQGNALKFGKPLWGTVSVSYQVRPYQLWAVEPLTYSAEYVGLLNAPGLPKEQWPEPRKFLIKVIGEDSPDQNILLCGGEE